MNPAVLPTFRWCLTIPCLLVFAAFALLNLQIFFSQLRNPQGRSLGPVVGGLFGAIGIFLMPIEGAMKYCWLPLVVDIGCGPMIVMALIEAIHSRESQS